MLPLLLTLLLQTSPPATPPTQRGDLDDLDTSWCLETGNCRPQSSGFDRPAPGILFLALGLVGLGLALRRADRLREQQ